MRAPRPVTALMLALLVCGCATAYAATAIVLAPTLQVTNGTDERFAIVVDGFTLARIEPMTTACVKLANLPPGDVTLGFRGVGVVLRMMPTQFLTDDGWAVTITGATTDGMFFATPAERCRAPR